jgi:hypothetical protein
VLAFAFMGGVAMRWLLTAVAGILIGASAFTVGSANAQPVPPPPPVPIQPGSTTDELADMVMDVIEGGGPAVPTTTPLPAPHP